MHTSYYLESENTYREAFGLGFEHLAPGMRIAHRPGITLSQQDNADEALDSVNAAMLHYDTHYATQTLFRQPLMVSTVTLQRLVGMTSKSFGLGRKRIQCFDRIALEKPVFGGDTLYAESEILETVPGADGGLVRVRTIGLNQRQDRVASLDYSFEMRDAAHLPIPAAGALKPVHEARFASHAPRADGAWVEQTGLFYEDLRPGETFIHYPRREIRATEASTHALRSLEIAPVYHGVEGAQPQLTEGWALAVTTALSTRTFGRVTANLAWTKVVFDEPLAPGDTVETRSTILEMRRSATRTSEGIVTVCTETHNQRGERVLSYERTLLVYLRSGETPYGAAGY